jgi:hypothetical protein
MVGPFWRKEVAMKVLGLVPRAGFVSCAVLAVAAFVPGGSLPVLAPIATTARPSPEAFGISQETVTAVSAAALVSTSSVTEPVEVNFVTSSLVRYIDSANGGALFTSVAVPSGVVIDFLGLSACDTVGGNFTAALYDEVPGATVAGLGFIESSARAGNGCGFDYNANPFAYEYDKNEGHNLVIAITQAAGTPTDGSAGAQALEIWWHRRLSPAPATPTFADVPDTDFGYQYIEALSASGITGGCGGGNFCPDNPVTRRQMAIFLAKALGLNWPH